MPVTIFKLIQNLKEVDTVFGMLRLIVCSVALAGFVLPAYGHDSKTPGRVSNFPAFQSLPLRIAQAESDAGEPPGRRRNSRLPGEETPSPPSKTETAPPQTQPSPVPQAQQPKNGLPPVINAPASDIQEKSPPSPVGPKNIPGANKAKEMFPPVSAVKELGAPLPSPDRWRIVDLPPVGYPRNLFDPYSTGNPLKGDRPFKDDWFFSLGVTSDTVLELRNLPTSVGASTAQSPGSVDAFGDGKQRFLSEMLVTEFEIYKGDTVFRPPDFEFRFVPAFNYNRLETREVGVVDVNPAVGTVRTKEFFGIEGLFLDYHLRNVSERYDFDSVRVGIQPFTADFRGFLFTDQPFGIRLFGTRANNRYQYNFGWFRQLDKDINSSLNEVSRPMRNSDIFVANLFLQDTPEPGFTSEGVVIYNRNREGGNFRYDENGFLSRPSALFDQRGIDYDVVYLGYNGDGHFGPINLNGAFYYALGEEWKDLVFDIKTDISAYLGALETSIDFDWIRLKLSGFYASGDSDPFDSKATGFDAIYENPKFAGSDSSYWIRQAIPFIGGGGVALSQRNGILASLRSSKDQGQSNFTNPGLLLVGLGADFNILTTVRISGEANQIWFNHTAVLDVLRQQASIDKEIGTDLSLELIDRPFFSQNVVLRLSGAVLVPGRGFKELFNTDAMPYSTVARITLNY